MTGSLHVAEAGLQEVESAWEEGGAPKDELVGIAAVVRATLYVQSNRPGAIGLYERANKVLPSER